MPNTREKLIELLKDANAQLQKQPGARVWGDLVDILVANGVTVLGCSRDCANCWKTKLVNAPKGEADENNL